MKSFIGCKVIVAAKIRMIHRGRDDNNAMLEFDDGSSVDVSEAYMDKHRPKTGGYYVKYPDGYESWSPADTFEDAYREITKGETQLILEQVPFE